MHRILGFEVSEITVLRVRGGADRISFKLVGAPSPFPEMQATHPNDNYGPYFSTEVRRGYAEEWLASIQVPPTAYKVVTA